MRTTVKEHYEGRYSSAGREIISIAFLVIFAILIAALIAVSVYVALLKS